MLWELSKKGEMSSHLVEIKRGFKRVDIWVETLKMDGFVYLCIQRDSKGHFQVEDTARTKAQGWEQNPRMSHAVDTAKTYFNQSNGFQPVSHCLLEAYRGIARHIPIFVPLCQSHP